jgi:hypothetical protein
LTLRGVITIIAIVAVIGLGEYFFFFYGR